MIDSFLIFLILIIDTIIELSIISTSKFSQYKLSSNIIGIFGYVFPNDFIEDESYNIGEITMGSSNTAQEETEDLSLNNSSIEKTLLPKCIQDEDIISIFRNNVYIEDYFISFLDQYLNILTASLSKIYNSKLFSIKKAENKKLQKDLGNIDVSNIGGIMEEVLQDLIKEIELSKDDSEPQDEGYNLGLNVAIIQIKKKLKKLS